MAVAIVILFVVNVLVFICFEIWRRRNMAKYWKSVDDAMKELGKVCCDDNIPEKTKQERSEQ